ncbi:hypothetical protein [Pseudonocardia adelaidensis]|uniref:hypothetical protein n=1 Tax=Pseudonocardia adelaidensis TaxID=648754 RepID=UPI0031EC4F5A
MSREQVQEEFTGYLGRLLDRWDGQVDSSVLSRIAAAERAGDLTRGSASGSSRSSWWPATPPTTHHLASSVTLLAGRAELWDRLRAERVLVRSWVEESWRLEAPIQGFYRLATADTEIGGVALRGELHQPRPGERAGAPGVPRAAPRSTPRQAPTAG